MHPRHIAPLLVEALSDTPVVVLTGAQQSGKSTLVQSLAASVLPLRQYLTLDDAVVLNAAKSDPGGFVGGLTGPVTLDEVQRAPELFPAIKAAVDRSRQPGRFLLTGSADVLLLPGIADSPAGRVEILSLWPLSSAELVDSAAFNRADWLFQGDLTALRIGRCERHDLIARLLAGGFRMPSTGAIRPVGRSGLTAMCSPSCSATCAISPISSKSPKFRTCCSC